MRHRNIIAIGGLTCTGKTTLALALADQLGGPDGVEIVVCDAVKIYRGADIGSGKLPRHERRGYEFHMVDVVPPGERYSAGRYMNEGRKVIDEIWARGKTPIVVGGTGLYYRALLFGICAAPPANAETRERLRRRKAAGEDLYQTLYQLDIVTAARVTRDDEKRIVRALEVIELTGRPFSSLRQEGAVSLVADVVLPVWLDAPRDWLLQRVSQRTRRMLDRGLGEETKELMCTAPVDKAPPLDAIGYRETVAFLKGELAPSALADAITAATMRLAKRQRTWFKKEQGATRLDAARGTAPLTASIMDLWRQYC